MRHKLNLARLNKISLDNQEKKNVKAGDDPPGPRPDIKSLCEDWCTISNAFAAEANYFL